MSRFRQGMAALLAASLGAGVAACRTTQSPSQTPPLVQPGAPGQAARTVAPGNATDRSGVQATPADVKFMQGMIHHHAQALDMVALLEKNTTSDDMRKLGERIRIS